MQGAGPGVGPRHPHVSHCMTAAPQLALQAALLVRGNRFACPSKIIHVKYETCEKTDHKDELRAPGSKGEELGSRGGDEEGTGKVRGRLGSRGPRNSVETGKTVQYYKIHYV